MTEALVSLLLDCSTFPLATVDIVSSEIFCFLFCQGTQFQNSNFPRGLVDKEVAFVDFDGPVDRGGISTQFIINVIRLDCRCEFFGSATPDKVVPSYSILRFDGNPFGWY